MITFKDFLIEAKYHQDKHIRPMFVDDWLVFGRDSSGEWYITISETWPDWGKYYFGSNNTPPEEMNPVEFERQVFKILDKHKGKSPSGWENYKDYFFRHRYGNEEQVEQEIADFEDTARRKNRL